MANSTASLMWPRIALKYPGVTAETPHFMKAGNFAILCIALVASGVVVRADDTPEQAAARAAMEQKMNELNQPAARPSPATNAAAAPVEVPVNDTSAAATPVTKAPAAEAPVAVAPSTASAVVTPVSSPPAVVAPVPRISTASAVAIGPAAGTGPEAMPARTLPAATLPTSSAVPARPSNELVTTTGATYKNVELQKVTSEGIVISYTPAQGGWAMTRVNFQDLPPEIRQEYEKP